jgi:hypothetical protein
MKKSLVLALAAIAVTGQVGTAQAAGARGVVEGAREVRPEAGKGAAGEATVDPTTGRIGTRRGGGVQQAPEAAKTEDAKTKKEREERELKSKTRNGQAGEAMKNAGPAEASKNASLAREALQSNLVRSELKNDLSSAVQSNEKVASMYESIVRGERNTPALKDLNTNQLEASAIAQKNGVKAYDKATEALSSMDARAARTAGFRLMAESDAPAKWPAGKSLDGFNQVLKGAVENAKAGMEPGQALFESAKKYLEGKKGKKVTDEEVDQFIKDILKNC